MSSEEKSHRYYFETIAKVRMGCILHLVPKQDTVVSQACPEVELDLLVHNLTKLFSTYLLVRSRFYIPANIKNAIWFQNKPLY